MSDPEWQQLVTECERIADDPEIFLISFMVIQAWGRMPARQPSGRMTEPGRRQEIASVPAQRLPRFEADRPGDPDLLPEIRAG